MKEIKRELDAREQLLWSGKPKQGVLFRGFDIFMVPFSLLWTWMAITSVGVDVSFSDEEAVFFTLFGSVFVLIGLYIVFGRFLLDSALRRKMFYGITDERVVIVSGVFRKKVQSLNLRTLSDVSLSEKANGEGTITFGPSSFLDSLYSGMGWLGIPQGPPKLEAIQNARKVYKMICDAQRR